MIRVTLEEAMHDACASVGIKPPRRVTPGRWAHTDTLERNGKGDGRVLVFDDAQGGICWNWQTGEQKRFTTRGAGETTRTMPRRDPERDRQRAEEQQQIEDACGRIVNCARQDKHPYLARKGFSEELGLVTEDPRPLLPRGQLGERMAHALPEGDGPFLIVPGRIGRRVTTVQFITAEGAKKNILGGVMGGSAHRIATGRETWVCEGIATALSVRAALRLLGRSATVLSAFSASNVAKVASGLTGAIIAADHDKPLEQFGGRGTGEFYATQSGCAWTMPGERGDFNDMHQREGLRAVALHLREVTG
jgi:putative DNA primase/helicase